MIKNKMANRISKYGGQALGEEGGVPDDWNDTQNTHADYTVTWAGYNLYKTLQANDVLIVGKYGGAEEFTTSTGTNNYVNTGSSTAYYIGDQPTNSTLDSNRYNVYVAGLGTDEASSDSTYDPDSFTNPSNAFDSDDDTYAEKTTSGGGLQSKTLGKTFTSKRVGYVRIITEMTADNNVREFYLMTYNGSTWDNEGKVTGGSTNLAKTTYVYPLNKEVQGIAIKFTTTSTGNSTMRLYTLEYGDFVNNSTLILDNIGLTFSGDESTFGIFTDFKKTTDSSVVTDISVDGGSTYDYTDIESDTATNISTIEDNELVLKIKFKVDDTYSTYIKGTGFVLR
jgi:hypothetical protein